jgi:hypothetical protein
MSSDTTALGQEPLEAVQPDDGDELFWSVTTIINALDRPQITWWTCEQTATSAIDNEATWKAMLNDVGRDDTITWLCNAKNRRPKNLLSDTTLGTAIHKVCETYALTGIRPDRDFIAAQVEHAGGPQTDIAHETDVLAGMLELFERWLQRFTPEYEATEVCVYSPLWGYAGQSDAFMKIDGVRFITDYKSTRKPRLKNGKPKTPYTEVALQLAAYRHADFAAVWRPRRFEKQFRRYYLLSADERARAVPVPEVDAGLCILITPEACEAYPVQCGPEIHNEFLYVQEAFRWQQEISKNVIGDPLQ